MTGDTDCHGVTVVGQDEDSIWWGTPHAWWVVGDPDESGRNERGELDGSEDGPPRPPKTPHHIEAEGYLGAILFQAHLIASSKEIAERFMRGFGVEGKIDFLAVQKLRRRKYEPSTTVYVTEEY